MTTDTKKKSRLGQILTLVLAVGISLGIIWLTNHYRREIHHFGHAGYIGLFVISIIGNATLFIPAPVFVVACAAGLAYGSIPVGIVAGLGSALGELTGYMAGYGGGAMVPEGQLYQRLHRFMQRRGMLPLFFLAAIPNPIFDVGGITAGILRIPGWKFLFSVLV